MIWLLVFLLIGPPAFGSKVMARVPGVWGTFARWWQERKLQAIAHDRVERTELRLLALQRDYTAMQRQLDDTVHQVGVLRRQYDQLSDELTHEKNRYWSAVGYIRKLLDALSTHSDTIPEPPELLRDVF